MVEQSYFNQDNFSEVKKTWHATKAMEGVKTFGALILV